MAMLKNRCGSCHGSTAKQGNKQEFALKFGNTTSLESLCNLTRPEKSLILQAPLAQEAGGLGLCRGEVFGNTDDTGYRELLKAIGASADELRAKKRFDMPGFRPNEHYLREMQRFGILPDSIAPAGPIDGYAADQAYWRSFWYRPRSER
jgi:hypothetical protein